MELFGFEIKRKVDATTKETKPLRSFVPKQEDEAVTTVSAGGYYGQYYDIDGTHSGSEKDQIVKYREAAEQPECDVAIQNIVDQAIVSSDGACVELRLDDLNYEQSIKEKIQVEFDAILKLFKFNENASDIFRKWYVDGKLYYHIVVDEERLSEGIQELRYVDPIYMKKVREVKSEHDKLTGIQVKETVDEYFVYSENEYGLNQQNLSTNEIAGIKVAEDAIVYCPSGIMDASRTKVISHLHKSLKLVNQLRMMEDALVIYRISRAPERRIFYIDVGNLPKGKAEEYVRNMMSQYRNKIVYDASSGEVRDDRRHKSMLEDFWLPRREGGRGTEITTLPGGENLGQIDDILFFQKKLYKSLGVPVARLEDENGFQIGRATEINREEVKFQKFIDRLRRKFSYVLIDALKTQLILKGIIIEEDWDELSEDISIDFMQDNYFSELKEFEVLRDRFEILSTMDEYVGKYYSQEWVRKNILQQSEQEIENIDKQIADEKADGDDEDIDDLMSSANNTSLEDDLTNGELERDMDTPSEGGLEKELI